MAQSKKDMESMASTSEPKAVMKKFWTSEKILSFGAFFISIATFFTIIHQNYLIKKQQFATVLPHLIINHGDGIHINGKLESCEFQLLNNGIGPAFINGSKYIYEGKEYEDLTSFFMDKVYTSPDLNFSYNDIFHEGWVLPAGDIINIIRSNDTTSTKILHGMVEKLKIEIRYSSIYDEKWKVNAHTNIPEKLE